MDPTMRLYENPPPYDNRSSETDPLMPRRVSHYFPSLNEWIRAGNVFLLTAAITSAIFVSVFPLSSCHDPLDPDVRDRIRKEWDDEHRLHQEEVHKRMEIEKHWRDERAHLREQWLRETQEHDREVREKREQWEKEMQERRGREEEERLRLNVFWTNPEPHTCTTYGTREYTARLVNVPSYYNRRVEACMATPIQIHGIEYKPKWCEDHGPNNVIGHWESDQHQPDCASTYWNSYKDLGCISPGSGQRRIEHYLENLPWGGDWREFCATTPASFRGMHFTGAEFCFQKAFGAVYGHWVIDDQSCD